MFSVEVYDLLLSTVPCLSRRLSEVDSDTPQKKKERKASSSPGSGKKESIG